MAIYADGVPMTTDKLLGLMALAIGGALAWFLFAVSYTHLTLPTNREV